MEIRNIRIEERLIHGQVVIVWLSHLHPDRIIIIDNETSTNEMQKKLLRMVCPPGTNLSIFSVDRAIERLGENPYEGEGVFILFKDPENLKEFFDKGYPIQEVNVGNMGGKKNSVLVKKGVSVTSEQAQIFRDLCSKGVKFTAKMVPNDSEVDFMKLIENL